MSRSPLLMLVCLASLVTPALATPVKNVPADPLETPVREFELGVSLFGLVNGSFMTEPDEADKIVRSPDGREGKALYGGFGGVGGGGGLSVIGSWRGIIGVEVQLYNSLDQAASEISKIDFTVSQTAWHLPILLRASLPAQTVRPFIYGGPEFVFPSKPTLEFDSSVPPALADMRSATADTYIAWAMGLGMEFRLPTEQDFRIPFQLRFVLNPSVGATVDERMEIDFNCPDGGRCTVEHASYISEWQYQAVTQLGFAWYFL